MKMKTICYLSNKNYCIMKTVYRKIVRCLSVSVIALAALSCTKDSQLKVSTFACAFDAGGGQKTISVASDTQWDAVLGQTAGEHFTLTKTEGAIVLEAMENLSTEEISARVIVTAGNKSATIHVVQAPAGKDFSILPENLAYETGNRGGSLTIAVRYAGDWTVSSDCGWCVPVVDEDGRSFTVAIDENEAGEPRSACLSVLSGAGAALTEILVNQSSAPEEGYDALLGEWEIHCDKWLTGIGSEAPEELGEGTYAGFSLTAGKSLNTLQMEDIFIDYSVLEVYYDAEERTIAIPLGVWCTPDAEFYDIPNTENYLAVYSTGENTEIKGGYLYGRISEDGSEISVTGIDDGYGWGMCYRSYSGMQMYADLYYTASSNVTLKKIR